MSDPPKVAAPLKFARRMPITIRVNGSDVASEVPARTTLLDWLRETVGLTGTRGLQRGRVPGARAGPRRRTTNERLLTLAAQCDGRDVVTIEGLAASDGTLHPVQRAFAEHDAFQCGYCTPGQIVSAVACIADGHAGDEDTVREWMSGHICRCSSYPQITAAVLAAATESPLQ